MANNHTLLKILPKYPGLEKKVEGFSKATSLDKDLFFLIAMQQFNALYNQAIRGNDEEKVRAKQSLTELLLPENIPNRSRYFFTDPRKLPELKDKVMENYEKELSQVHKKYGTDIIDNAFDNLGKAIKEVYKKAEDESKGRTEEEREDIIKRYEAGLMQALFQYTLLIDPENKNFEGIKEAEEYLEGKRERQPEAFMNNLQEAISEMVKDAGPIREVIAVQLLRDIQEDPSKETFRSYVKIYSEGLIKKLIDEYRTNGKVSIGKFKDFAREKLEKNPKGYETLVSEYYARSFKK